MSDVSTLEPFSTAIGDDGLSVDGESWNCTKANACVDLCKFKVRSVK